MKTSNYSAWYLTKKIKKISMKIASTLPIICFEVFLASATNAWAQESSPDGVWVEIDGVVEPTIASTTVDSSHAGAEPSTYVKARAYRLFDVDQQRLSKLLETAPPEFAEGAAPVVLAIPFPDGSYQRVRIEESPIFSPELQERYPNIRTYRAQGGRRAHSHWSAGSHSRWLSRDADWKPRHSFCGSSCLWQRIRVHQLLEERRRRGTIRLPNTPRGNHPGGRPPAVPVWRLLVPGRCEQPVWRPVAYLSARYQRDRRVHALF